ncbi:btk-binding protein-related [Anaeramoeba ignava]|uniref:Btk-binding protein-related n=1 Tax=Anaeramoeba ignava TaxID=1746090 RepID=A0A9Q0LKG6_ANAIG|nr:btk-binding protein-related [Anaeramoeba ignava]
MQNISKIQYLDENGYIDPNYLNEIIPWFRGGENLTPLRYSIFFEPNELLKFMLCYGAYLELDNPIYTYRSFPFKSQALLQLSGFTQKTISNIQHSYYSYYSRKKPNPKIDLDNIQSYLSICEDFEYLVGNEELSDMKFPGGFPAHSLLVKCRTGIEDLFKITEYFQTKTSEEIKAFLEWVYCGKINHLYPIYQYAKDLGIQNFVEKTFVEGLRNSLKELYEQDETKDFTIFVQGTEIKVHKLIFFVRSQLYRGMFLLVNDESSEVQDYSGKSADTFKIFVKFVYYDFWDETFSNDIVFELGDVIDYYQLNENSGLKKEIAKMKKKRKKENRRKLKNQN